MSKRQILAYLQKNQGSLDPFLKSQTPDDLSFSFHEIYRCANGKILAVSRDGTGSLYDSVNDWQAQLEELIDLGKREPVHILYKQIPHRDRFIQEIPVLISNLARELELAPDALDKTRESLATVDRAIASQNQPRNFDSSRKSHKKILGCLIAYVGEVVKVAIDGEWQIDRNKRTGWEPVIVARNGKTSSFCIQVFDELYEAEESDFFDLTSMLIEAHQR